MRCCCPLISILIPVFLLVADGVARASGAHANQTITLAVDATEAPRKLFHAREVIPVSPGPLTLYYPQWIPGEHGPTGPINNLSGLKFTVNGKPLPWRRDPVDMYAFHLDVPQGATAVEAGLEFLAPTFGGGFTSGSSTTSHLVVFSWNWLLLSPPVAWADDLVVNASVRLPSGWKFRYGADEGSGVGRRSDIPNHQSHDTHRFASAGKRAFPLGPALDREPDGRDGHRRRQHRRTPTGPAVHR